MQFNVWDEITSKLLAKNEPAISSGLKPTFLKRNHLELVQKWKTLDWVETWMFSWDLLWLQQAKYNKGQAYTSNRLALCYTVVITIIL